MEISQTDKDFFNGLPKRWMACGTLITFQDKFLILKPNYKPGWTVTGGVIDPDETPIQACYREIKEELGLELEIEKLVSIDNVVDPEGERPEALHFIFKVKELTLDQVENIRLQEEELDDHLFLSIEQAVGKLEGGLKKRINQSLLHMHRDDILWLKNGERTP